MFTEISTELYADNGLYDVFEGMTSISAVINSVCEKNNNRKILKILYDNAVAEKRSREISFLKAKSNEIGFELSGVEREKIDAIVTGKTHGGFVAVTTKRSFSAPTPDTVKPDGFYVLIEGIEDPYNFGYSVRSLYAAGADGLILPPRNWLELSGAVAKSSAGTSELFDIYVDDPEDSVRFFKSLGYRIVCASIRDSVSLYDANFDGPILLIVGGEKRGISRGLLDLSDFSVRIDYGRKFSGSLPTASALSVIAFEITRVKGAKK